MARFGRVGGTQPRTTRGAANAFERPGEPTGVAGELDRRRVRKVLPLSGHSRLDEVAKERANESDHNQADRDHQHNDDSTTFVFAIATPSVRTAVPGVEQGPQHHMLQILVVPLCKI